MSAHSTDDRLAGLLAELRDRLPATDPRDRVSVADVVDAYLADARQVVAPRTFEGYELVLAAFRSALGTRPVAGCALTDLRDFMDANAERWRSGWKRRGVARAVQAAFNWAVRVRLARENPFSGYRVRMPTKNGRDMQPEEFQAVLRHCHVRFRQLAMALRLSGARPGELARIRWSDIDWRRSLIELAEHKTSRKTGKPRMIAMPAAMVKLLLIIRRNQASDRPRTAKEWVHRILAGGPMLLRDLNDAMGRLGYGSPVIAKAREQLGCIGGVVPTGQTGRWLRSCQLPPGTDGHAAPNHVAADGRVFLNSHGRPWTRYSMNCYFRRVRQRAALPPDTKIYSIRHFHATAAVKLGVPLKSIATLLGHADTRCLEAIYLHADGDWRFLQRAAEAAAGLAQVPRPLPTPGMPPLPPPAPRPIYPRVQPVAAGKPAAPVRFGDAQRKAFELYRQTVAVNPTLPDDAAVYAWLSARPQFAAALPPTLASWRRYLNIARRELGDESTRRERRGAATAASAGARAGRGRST